MSPHLEEGVLVLGAAAATLALLGVGFAFAAGAVLGMRCPRCGARAAWMASGWGRLRPRPARRGLCARCRRWFRTEWLGDRWVAVP